MINLHHSPYRKPRKGEGVLSRTARNIKIVCSLRYAYYGHGVQHETAAFCYKENSL